jgi:hypothetical protein
MKSLSMFLLLALLLLGSGCFPLTQMVKERADGYTRRNKKTQEWEQIPGKSAYYALAPLTVPTDMALTPVYALAFGVWVCVGAPGFAGFAEH